MFNLGAGEIALILVVALLVLGPKRLPELARGLGKFMREFRRQTDEVRGVVEREFYRMDQEIQADLPSPADLTVRAPELDVTLRTPAPDVTMRAAAPGPPPLPMQAPKPAPALTEEARTQPSGVYPPAKPPAKPGGS